MSFNDDDLKRLKDLVSSGAKSMVVEDVPALLARLEAAEACIDAVDGCCGCLTVGHCTDEYKAWRKSCGN